MAVNDSTTFDEKMFSTLYSLDDSHLSHGSDEQVRTAVYGLFLAHMRKGTADPEVRELFGKHDEIYGKTTFVGEGLPLSDEQELFRRLQDQNLQKILGDYGRIAFRRQILG